MVRAVLFDLDGTLVDSRRDIARCVNHTLQRLGRGELSVEQVEAMVGDGVRQLLTRALGPMDDAFIKRALDIFLPYYLEHCVDETRPYPGVVEGLLAFSGLPMAVVTNKPSAHTAKTLSALKLDVFFKAVLAGDSLSTRKPAPEPLWEALRRLGTPPSQALMVGDSGLDIQAARAAGVPVAAVTYGFRPREEIEEFSPDYMIDRFSDLKGVVL